METNLSNKNNMRHLSKKSKNNRNSISKTHTINKKSIRQDLLNDQVKFI